MGILSFLLGCSQSGCKLVEGGLSREDAYALVQSAAMETWNTGTPFRSTLRTRAAASDVKLDEARLDLPTRLGGWRVRELVVHLAGALDALPRFLAAWNVPAGMNRTSPALSVTGALPSTSYSSVPSRT